MAATDSDQSLRIFVFWTVCQLTGGLCFSLALLTASLSKKVYRMPTWFSFCSSWVLCSLTFILLPISGQLPGSHPPLALCVTQSSMIYASAVLIASTAVALLTELWLAASALARSPLQGFAQRHPRARTMFLVASPYALYTLVVLINVGITLSHPHSVGLFRHGLFCTDRSEVPWRIAAALSILAIAAILVLEFLCARHHYRVWSAHGHLESAKPSRTLLIRVMLLTIFVLACILVIFVHAMLPQPARFRDFEAIFMALFLLASFFIFGLSKDLCLVWLTVCLIPFRRWRRVAVHTESSAAEDLVIDVCRDGGQVVDGGPSTTA
ncbi:hypothetical protein PUNSTDRAFT_135543 [Punctularia strigosozonata HHB-11173 SS5]|uniref:uncharacterized protein n=1 Tax=Punctularia strigosozonata (strain HHB-11173) TaxID=741275 RepID=UPI0004416E37|nr:uncharacterized protein PUNSTDRAFT_135543 [Punctularia strigosozonata HHB-11173 SS5]EIN08027.1 hypothetical protein PUNSTDRAFT_135543 [Punctularia strigosozonata HHB-11173 SS5]